MELFGFEIKRKSDEREEKQASSFVDKDENDGALSISNAVPGTGGAMSSFMDLDGDAKSEAELVHKYRRMLQQPEIQQATDDIVNEMFSVSENFQPVTCVTDDLDYGEPVKKRIREEFDNVLELLDFSNQGYDIIQKWYIDGRLNYHVIIDEKSPRDGIKALRYIDPRKIRKVKEYEESNVGHGVNSVKIKKLKNEYYMYVEHGFIDFEKKSTRSFGASPNTVGLKIAKDAIVQCTSGLVNDQNTLVLSHLHKAIKPLNQLRMMEDAAVVYRISRAPERRVFYIDVGNLPKLKAEQYLRDMMTKHKNRLIYDATTGEVKDDRRHMSMTDDFWLPRREGGRGTEITTLPGGQNLGEMEDIVYFQKRLYRALNVPISRMESDAVFSLGRSSEITRDEIKFSKFIRRLRTRFSILFDLLLERQLILKGIISDTEWEEIRNKIRYDFMIDNHFEEMKEAEILRERVSLLRDMDEYVGQFYSREWVRRNILRMTDEDIEEIKKQIETEREEEPPLEGEEDDGNNSPPFGKSNDSPQSKPNFAK